MEWIAIVWAGFVATTAAAAFFWLLRSLGWTLFSPAIQVGCVFLRDPKSPLTETVGFLLVLTFGSTLVPAIYSSLLDQMGGASVARGVLVGLVHGMISAVLLVPVGTLSACVRSGALPPPGRLGVGWGRITPVAIVMGHGLFGGIAGAILAGF